MKEQYLINFVIKGDNNVGKTSIIQQYSNNQLYNLPKSVNIQDLSFKIMQLMESTFTIQIRNYKNSLSKGVKVRYLNADAIVLVYDVTKRTSFEWLNQEVQLINEIFYDNYPFICIIGNKEDLLERREVSKEEANKFCKTNNLKYYECSALCGNTVQEVFFCILRNTIETFILQEEKKSLLYKRANIDFPFLYTSS